MRTKSIRPKSARVITLGCSKNLVDSENLVTQLQAGQVEAEHQDTPTAAETVIINTCGFIDLAKQESIDTILECVELKKAGEIEKVYVTGCLSERYQDDLRREIPEVDAYFGTMDMPALLAQFDVDYKHELLGSRVSSTPMHYAYLKISEGCNRTCSFCAIPQMRGQHRSKPIEDVLLEAQGLVKRGVKEVMLIAQELTYYGLDLYKERSLARLLDQLAQVDGLAWIRLHYAYPSKFPREVLPVIARYDNICNYLDMPLQHASDGVLARMRRQITQAEMVDLIGRARADIPELALRTTMMTGFPGETQQEFEELVNFVEEMQFDRLGVFEYSHEEGTTAHDLKDDVLPEIKKDRANQLMELQRNISYRKNTARVGQTYQVLIDRKEESAYYGRTEYDSPGVDNEVIIPAAAGYLRVGDFCQVRIDDATEYDLIASPVRS